MKQLVTALLLAMGFLHQVESLTAATASVTFTGVIEQVRVFGTPIWDSSVTVGAPYSATFLYDTTALDFAPPSTEGAYRFMGPSAVTFTFGNYSFSRDLSFVTVLDNASLFGDGFSFYTLGDPPNSPGLFNVRMAQYCAQAPTDTLSSDGVDNVALLPGIFSMCGDRHGTFRAEYDGGNGFTGIDFVASSVMVVPEPGATALTILGLVAVAALRQTNWGAFRSSGAKTHSGAC